MNLTIKTLKGGKFVVEVEPTQKIVDVKAIVEAAKPEFPSANMKLIHSGKVLKDDMVVESCNIQPTDFLVCMVTKAKKPVAAPPAPAATSTESTATPMETTTTETSTIATATESTTAATSTDSATATSSTSNTETTTAAAAPSTTNTTSDEFPGEVVSNLVAMGFPEAEVRACLRASSGNPDIAVDFLMNGIPPTASEVQTPTTASSSSSDPLEALRSHPQFDSLRRLVQTNPSMLQAVLTQIGQQQPELLQAINANQAAFLQMMNEPITEASSTPVVPPAPSRPTQRSNNNAGNNPIDAMQGMTNPAQMAQMISSLSPTELNEMATMMGVAPDQLSDMAQMIGQIGNQGQFQDYMMQALQQEGAGGASSGGGGQQVLRLTEEEMAAVDRLTEMGFDRTEAAQAFLACDKNEALAANLLMDSADGFGFGGPPPSSGGNNDAGGANDDGDDMYD